jgi:hypothetical protein
MTLTMHRRTLTVTTLAVALVVGSAIAPTGRASSSPRFAHAYSERLTLQSAGLPTRPNRADWEKIEAAARMRRIGLERHRTAHFRAYAGFLGLSELGTIHPLAAGRCREALTYLYGNLLDLRDAEPGENWTPLRRLVSTEPSIRACAPRRATQQRT